jgi:hypothetical protein
MSEVRRLEGCKTQQMRDLINAKARELAELCATTHVPAPALAPMLAEVSVRAQAESTGGAGQLADVLSKLVHMLAEVGAAGAGAGGGAGLELGLLWPHCGRLDSDAALLSRGLLSRALCGSALTRARAAPAPARPPARRCARWLRSAPPSAA